MVEVHESRWQDDILETHRVSVTPRNECLARSNQSDGEILDSENMVFRFREMEMTPTIEEVLISYKSVAMCNIENVSQIQIF